MIGPGLEGQTFNAYAYGFDSGLVGQLTVSIYDDHDDLVLGPVTSSITEVDLGGAQSAYRYVGLYPTVGNYIILWEDPLGNEAVEELVSGDTPPLPATAPIFGPCQQWLSFDDVADFCDIAVGTDTQVGLETAAEMASTLLYRLTGKKYSGICERIIRPCRSGCGCHHTEDGWRWMGNEWWRNGSPCGCGCISQITIMGTVRAIIEVTIDGELIAPDEYRVDEFKYLVRMRDTNGVRQWWPRCQNLDLPATEPGTFQITYLAGTDPPSAGVEAAKQLACELYKGSVGGECALPSGVTRILRQGLVIERIDSLGAMLRRGATGLPLVDSFIAVFNPTGAMVGPAIWSPDFPPHRKVT